MNYIKQCNLCGKSLFKRILNSIPSDYPDKLPQSFNMEKCISCGLVFLNPKPSKEDLNLIYQPNYYPQNWQTKYAKTMLYKSNKEKVFYFLKKNPFQLINKVLRRIFSERSHFLEDKSRLLDIGCGNGVFLLDIARAVKKRGYKMKLYGVDIIVPKNSIFKDYNINLIREGLEKTNFPDNYFHFITGHHVIEHFNNPLNVFKNIYRITKPKGIIALEAPNINSFSFKFFKKYWVGIAIPSHLYYFSTETIKQYAQKTGFKVKKIRYVEEAETFLFSLLRWLKIKEDKVNYLARNSFLNLIFFPFVQLLNIFRIGDTIEIILEK